MSDRLTRLRHGRVEQVLANLWLLCIGNFGPVSGNQLPSFRSGKLPNLSTVISDKNLKEETERLW